MTFEIEYVDDEEWAIIEHAIVIAESRGRVRVDDIENFALPFDWLQWKIDYENVVASWKKPRTALSLSVRSAPPLSCKSHPCVVHAPDAPHSTLIYTRNQNVHLHEINQLVAVCRLRI